MANKRFSEEATFSLIPKQIFPLWFPEMPDFEVVKNHFRIVYRICFNESAYYLKIVPEPEDKIAWPLDIERYEQSSDFARHLHSRGAPIARPVSSINDRYVEVCTHTGVKTVIQVSEEVPGTTLTASCKDLAAYEKCGTALAKFHRAAESYPRASEFDAQAWEQHWVKTGAKIPLTNETLISEYDAIDEWLKINFPLPGGKGLTHGDTNIFNFIDNGDAVSIIDIDDPEYTWYAVDLANPLRERNEEISHDERLRLWSALLAGYSSIRPIEIDYETITWLLRLWSLDTYVLFMPDGVNKEWMQRLLRFIENPEKW